MDAAGKGDTEDTNYTFAPGDKAVFDGSYYGENANMSKVDAIVREIGEQPVLAFGNSSGDLAMEIYNNEKKTVEVWPFQNYSKSFVFDVTGNQVPAGK